MFKKSSDSKILINLNKSAFNKLITLAATLNLRRSVTESRQWLRINILEASHGDHSIFVNGATENLVLTAIDKNK